MTTSEVIFAAMKEAVNGPSGKTLKRKFKVSTNVRVERDQNMDDIHFLLFMNYITLHFVTYTTVCALKIICSFTV